MKRDWKNELRDWDPANTDSSAGSDEPRSDLLHSIRSRLDGDSPPPAWAADESGVKQPDSGGGLVGFLQYPWRLASVAGAAVAAILLIVLVVPSLTEVIEDPQTSATKLAADKDRSESTSDNMTAAGSIAPGHPAGAVSGGDDPAAPDTIDNDILDSGQVAGIKPQPEATDSADGPGRRAPIARPVQPPTTVATQTNTTPSLADPLPATTAALQARPVQLVLTASNGTRVYWTHHSGS